MARGATHVWAWMKVYLPGALDRGAQTLEEVWLVVDWPEGAAEAYHYYLAHLHREPTVARLSAVEQVPLEYRAVFPTGERRLGAGSL
jgi:hypothetical protein